ncbi:D-alanine--D-alanine ligase [Pseudoflavonifractor sp. MSJ-37]|uniref:D-alanine--D-alanine ligase family protein n=1 Tax=Pseudoflavonifractor sp. MSJ-37 TaxID=2841531 RepID=UPI001C1095A3|nr:D-alanine--D-alanine ligase [Pseudoflavonifractor sp. MSJ-37]MBU5434558.1 D-alanine--D-alanine ligase [Pseudoflavonifractor sp. MSJ-37]
MKIVVLAGGLSPERNVSFASSTMIAQALLRKGHEVAMVDSYLGLEDYEHPLSDLFRLPPPLPDPSIKEQEPDLEAVKASRKLKSGSLFGQGVLAACEMADVVFNGLHGESGEDGRIQAALDMLGIPFTGSNYLGSAIAMDKNYTKRLAEADGILTPQWRTVRLTDEAIEETERCQSLPCVVKIPNGGSSVGVFICRTKEELGHALQQSRRFGSKVLVEQYIQGRDIFCAVLEGESLPPIEVMPKSGFYDYKNKYVVGASLEICPAKIDGAVEAQMRSAAKRIHELLGLTAYSRSDFVVDDEGRPWFLEVNTLPGMTDASLLPQEAAAVGIDYDTLCQKIVDASLADRREGK